MIKVLVIGDVIIDKYIYGTSERLSPEATKSLKININVKNIIVSKPSVIPPI